MSVEEHDANAVSLPASSCESLTDVIDEWSRQAFQRALERRHAAPAYPAVIESARLVPKTPS